MRHATFDREHRPRPIVVGNWKMCAGVTKLDALPAIANCAKENPSIDVAICPPALLIAAAIGTAPDLAIGGQDCHERAEGPFTGGNSARLLVGLGASLALVGHSERRHGLGETSDTVRAKASCALHEGLTVIICVGDTQAERDAGDAASVVAEQVLDSVPCDASPTNLMLAYEPVWAIGTGRTPSHETIQRMTAAIRGSLRELLGASASRQVRILYGGSVTALNAGELLAARNVDGLLVGSASLSAEAFVPLIRSAAAIVAPSQCQEHQS